MDVSTFISFSRPLFNTSFRDDLLVINSLGFSFSVNVLILLSFLKIALLGVEFLFDGFFFFHHFDYIIPLFLVYMVSDRKSAVNLAEFHV